MYFLVNHNVPTLCRDGQIHMKSLFLFYHNTKLLTISKYLKSTTSQIAYEAHARLQHMKMEHQTYDGYLVDIFC